MYLAHCLELHRLWQICPTHQIQHRRQWSSYRQLLESRPLEIPSTSGRTSSRESPLTALARSPTPARDISAATLQDGPRDAATIVNELRSELDRRNIRPAYVLVGHSSAASTCSTSREPYPPKFHGLPCSSTQPTGTRTWRINATANRAYGAHREVTFHALDRSARSDETARRPACRFMRAPLSRTSAPSCRRATGTAQKCTPELQGECRLGYRMRLPRTSPGRDTSSCQGGALAFRKISRIVVVNAAE